MKQSVTEFEAFVKISGYFNGLHDRKAIEEALQSKIDVKISDTELELEGKLKIEEVDHIDAMPSRM